MQIRYRPGATCARVESLGLTLAFLIATGSALVAPLEKVRADFGPPSNVAVDSNPLSVRPVRSRGCLSGVVLRDPGSIPEPSVNDTLRCRCR